MEEAAAAAEPRRVVPAAVAHRAVQRLEGVLREDAAALDEGVERGCDLDDGRLLDGHIVNLVAPLLRERASRPPADEKSALMQQAQRTRRYMRAERTADEAAAT